MTSSPHPPWKAGVSQLAEAKMPVPYLPSGGLPTQDGRLQGQFPRLYCSLWSNDPEHLSGASSTQGDRGH